MTTKCIFCGAPVPAEKRDCQACGQDNGAPNVRLAASDSERSLLERRLQDGVISCSARGCAEVLERFGLIVQSSKAVIARSLAIVQDLLEEGQTYTSYHRQLISGARIANENMYDKTRTQVDAALFPNFYQEIVFAALSLNGHGVTGYGNYVMTLKEPLIARRASVFEANAYDMVDKLGWLLTKPIPPRHRASWPERHKLAMAKLHPELSSVTKDQDFPSILINDRGGTGNSDFVEVHIYGPINAYTIEQIIGPKPITREDRLIYKRLKRKTTELNIIMEIN